MTCSRFQNHGQGQIHMNSAVFVFATELLKGCAAGCVGFSCVEGSTFESVSLVVPIAPFLLQMFDAS